MTASPVPTKAIGADPTQPFSFLPSVDLSDLLILDYDFIPDTTHFLQLEQPEMCVSLMLEFLETSPGSPFQRGVEMSGLA